MVAPTPRSSRCIAWHAVSPALAMLVAGVAVAAEPTAEDLLIGRGLTRVDRVWLLPQELTLRQTLTELPERRDRISALERELDARIEQQRVAWQESRATREAFQQALVKLRSDDPRRAAVMRQVEALETIVQPAKLGGQPDVRTKIIAWTSERNDLTQAIVEIRQTLPQLLDRYAALLQHAEIVKALRQTGDQHRLGPQRGYQADVQKLGEYERLVFTAWVPMHWQAGLPRITGLVDDRAPLTFSLLETGEHPTLLTATAAEAAGIVVPPDARHESIAVPGFRQLTARKIELPYLRFGGCVLRNVTAYVLSPEAEDCGCRIGRQAFAEHSLKLEPERLRLWIDAK